MEKRGEEEVEDRHRKVKDAKVGNSGLSRKFVSH